MGGHRMNLSFFKIKKRKTTRPIKEKNNLKFFESKLQIIVSILTILGISIASTTGFVIEHLPCVQRNIAEKNVEKIKVTESKEYIESILGLPQQTAEIEYTDSKQKTTSGKKSIFINEYYTFIIYFDESNSCIGYFLISNDDDFSPKLHRGKNLFDLSISESGIDNMGFLSAIGHFANNRPDCSSFHIQYYTHHISLNGCYVGVGISTLGEIDKDRTQALIDYSPHWINGYSVTTDDNKNRMETLGDNFAKIKPNVFSVFLANDTYDVDELLSRELQLCLSATHIDLRILSE